MRKLGIFLLALFLLAPLGKWGKSTSAYYMRADGTATTLAAATGPSTDASKCLSLWVAQTLSPSPGDFFFVSDKGGTYYVSQPWLQRSNTAAKISWQPGVHYVISGVTYPASGQMAGGEIAPSGANVPTAKYGAWALDIDATQTVSATAATDNATGYASAANALAGIPAVAAGYARLGTVVINNASGGDFIPGTTALNAAGITVTYADNPTVDGFKPSVSGTAGDGYITYMAVPGESPVFDGSVDVRGSGTGSWSVNAAHWETAKVFYAPSSSEGRPNSLWITKGATSGPGMRVNSSTPTNDSEFNHFSVVVLATGATDAPHNPYTFYDTIRTCVSKYTCNLQNLNYIKLSGIKVQHHSATGGLHYLVGSGSAKASVLINGSDHIYLKDMSYADVETTCLSMNSTNITMESPNADRIYNDTLYNSVTSPQFQGAGILFSSRSTTIVNPNINMAYTLYNGTSRPNCGYGIIGWINSSTGNDDCAGFYIDRPTISGPFALGIYISGRFQPTGAYPINGIINGPILSNGYQGGNDGDLSKDTDGIGFGDAGGFAAGNYFSSIVVSKAKITGYGNSACQTSGSWRGIDYRYILANNIGTNANCWGGIKVGPYDTLRNATLYNIWGNNSGGITDGGSGGATVDNVIVHTVAKNSANHGSAYGFNLAAGSILNNTTAYNTAGDAYNGAFTGSVNLTSDPLFVNANGGNFNLKGNSPCARTGLLTAWNGVASVTDLNNFPITNAGGTVTASYLSMGGYQWLPPSPLGLGLGITGGNFNPGMRRH